MTIFHCVLSLFVLDCLYAFQTLCLSIHNLALQWIARHVCESYFLCYQHNKTLHPHPRVDSMSAVFSRAFVITLKKQHWMNTHKTLESKEKKWTLPKKKKTVVCLFLPWCNSLVQLLDFHIKSVWNVDIVNIKQNKLWSITFRGKRKKK